MTRRRRDPKPDPEPYRPPTEEEIATSSPFVQSLIRDPEKGWNWYLRICYENRKCPPYTQWGKDDEEDSD